jgi:quercetin dioxygenase-like cupin family protein
MDVTAPDQLRATPGPPDWFTGTVTMQPVATQPAPGRAAAVLVSFAPGARTAWHTHPFGQILFVLQGRARVQSAGGAIVELGPGSSVRFDAGEEHWHGAAPDQPMVHLALQEADDQGTGTYWDRHVTDEEYGSVTRPA